MTSMSASQASALRPRSSRTARAPREDRRPMAGTTRKRKRRPRRGVLVRRWLGVGALCLVGLLYYRPLHTYVDTRHTLVERASQVASLRGERQRLQRKLADATGDVALVREPRRLGRVKSGGRLF